MAKQAIATPTGQMTAVVPSPAQYNAVKQRVQEARTKMVAASVAIGFIALIALALVVANLSSSDASTTSDIELTYRKLATPSTEATNVESASGKTTGVNEEVPDTEESIVKRRGLDDYTLLCTYGDATNASTVFAPDGMCDLIFFDSAYKGFKNLPWEKNFAGDMTAFLSAAQRYENTELGVAFAYKYHTWMRKDLQKRDSDLLDVFWRSGIFHFGIIDMPVTDVDPPKISDALTTLKELSMVAMKRPDTLRQPYTVFGATTGTIAKSYASLLRDVYTPTLFISHGHYDFGDNTVPDCKMVPPTLLKKPTGSQSYTFDLGDALSALQLAQDAGASAKWLVSVSLKGRWTMAKTDSIEVLADCNTDSNAESFRTYMEVCTESFFRRKMNYSSVHEAAYAFKVFGKIMFVYDNERGLCTKMCRLKSKDDHLKFGIAVYDLDYEDYNNACTDFNLFGAFSRLKMVRKLVNYFRKPTSSGASCDKAIPCPKGAAA